jgi:hypothetical protein
MAIPTVPFATILSKLSCDSDLAVAILSDASELLLVTDKRHLSLLMAQRDLSERLATRHRELAATVKGLEATSGRALLDVVP